MHLHNRSLNWDISLHLDTVKPIEKIKVARVLKEPTFTPEQKVSAGTLAIYFSIFIRLTTKEFN